MSGPIDDEAEAWERWRETRDIEARNRLVLLYRPLVVKLAAKIRQRIKAVPLDDMISLGIFGLIDAIGTFDIAKGNMFSTFCVHRIIGAIIDGIRNESGYRRKARPPQTEPLGDDDAAVECGGFALVAAKDEVNHLLRNYSGRSLRIVKQYILLEMTMKAIAKNERLTESRVSMLCSMIPLVRKYRAALKRNIIKR